MYVVCTMEGVKTVCNWTRSGCDWEKAVQTILGDEVVKFPDTGDILHDDRALLLHRRVHETANQEELEPCEIQLKVFPRYKISALTIICTVPKIEVFLGSQDEYYETEHGCLLNEENDNIGDLRSYRYDIEIEKSGICELTLKLLTNSNEICVFAILLQIGPNPNGITTLLSSGINIENVQKMLEASSKKLTPNAEKCKQFVEMYSKTSPSGTASVFAPKQNDGNNLEQLKQHIDKRLDEIESKVLARLDAIESQQLSKLDEILKTLQN